MAYEGDGVYNGNDFKTLLFSVRCVADIGDVGRSRASVQRVFMQNMGSLSSAYSKRFRDKPGLNGQIVVRFAIDGYGKVTDVRVVKSTINDAEFEDTIVNIVKSWVFDEHKNPDNITEIIYPFNFSQ